MRWIILLTILAQPLSAQDCPPAADISGEMSEIMADLKVSRGTVEARRLSDRLWELWLVAPDAKAQGLLDLGMAARSQFDLSGARKVLDELVAYCPDYVEGYNQRAFASYLALDFEAALADLDIVLDRMPEHLGALSGKGLTLMGLGRHDEAQAALRAALALNPWMAERELLSEPLEQDI